MPETICPLVIRFGRVGDMILLQPLLRRLHARYGQPCTLVGIGRHSLELYREHSDVAEVTALRSHHRPFVVSPEQWRAVHRLRAMRDRPVYVAEPQASSLVRIRLLLTLAGIAPEHCVFLNDVPLPEASHWIEHLLAFADATPAAFRTPFERVTATTPHTPAFSITDAERDDCRRWLAARQWDAQPLVLLQPANKRTLRWNGVRRASADDKSWPAAHWRAVAQAIHAALPDAHILLCGAPAETHYLEQIRAQMGLPCVAVVADDLPLPRLKALLALAHSMISVDTGPAHLAAAMGCPLVVMFGSVAPSHWTPRGRAPEMVKALGGPPRSRRVDAITPADVIEAWQALPPRSTP